MKNRKKSGWIWCPSWQKEDDNGAQLVCFRKTLEFEKVPEQLEIKLSADSRYKLYINETLVQDGPSKGNQKVWYYDRIPIHSYLYRGKNVLAIEVLRYPTEHFRGNFTTFRTRVPGLYVEMCSEKTTESEFAAGWKCRKKEDFHIISENPYFAPMQIQESVKGSIWDHGWKSMSFDDAHWEDAMEYSHSQLAKEKRLLHMEERKIPFARKTVSCFENIEKIIASEYPKEEWNAFLKGKKKIYIAPYRREVIELNAGELKTAYLRLAVCGGEKSKIKILESECYAGEIQENEDPFKRMPLKGNRTDSENGKLYGITDSYQVCGSGTSEIPEIYEPFWFRTFRFVRLEIETMEVPLQLLCFDYEETEYPLEILASVETSDSSLKAIWDISVRTLRRCMHDTYMDCPFYEQIQYAMDARNQILYTYAISGDDRLARQCMEDFRNSAGDDGLLNSSYPNYEKQIIPGFQIYYIGMVYDHMQYFGDKALVKKHMPTICGILDYFQKNIDTNGIVGKLGGLNRPGQYWSFIDWTPEWDKTNGVPDATLSGSITMESLLYILGLQYAAELCGYIGMQNRKKQYAEQAAILIRNVKKHCTGAMGMLQDGPGVEKYSQHTQVFAVLTGVITRDEGYRLLKETLENPTQYAQCSVAMMHYLFRALEKSGLYEYTDRLWDIWRVMVRNHMTTCAEDALQERSDCHAWGAVALYELPAVVLGTRPAKPGWEEIIVEPQTGSLSWARGVVPTAKGLVKIAWEKNKDNEMLLCIGSPKEVCVSVSEEYQAANHVKIEYYETGAFENDK